MGRGWPLPFPMQPVKLFTTKLQSRHCPFVRYNMKVGSLPTQHEPEEHPLFLKHSQTVLPLLLVSDLLEQMIGSKLKNPSTSTKSSILSPYSCNVSRGGISSNEESNIRLLEWNQLRYELQPLLFSRKPAPTTARLSAMTKTS